ncbi:uncharacterized protein CMC5_019720 [Chondromyces crocatus]|uniref:Uncharacterized protein n=1 Tax=Chondromyces crocatus TaxID=52 RepID=A0A0K1EAE8_CHOCO|nr:uncharacterized protein CMC5_019720 [Chondromyces crocatus]
MEVRATEADGDGGVLVQLVTPEAEAWEYLTPSGDDLYAFLALVSDRRGGAERIEERVCRVHAEELRSLVGHWDMGPKVTVDVEACATAERQGGAELPLLLPK